MPADLGYRQHGNGPLRVLVLHDWFCDHTSWDAALPYLTRDRFTYVFADLRGYGASREITGSYCLDEAANDAIALADKLGWARFSLIGHSMSGLIVQRILQLVPARIARVVAIAPVSPAGMKLDRDTIDRIQAMALADDETRYSAVRSMWGSRLSETWIRYKLQRWRETAAPAAAAGYVALWGGGGIVAEGARGLETPMLVVGCAHDAPSFQAGALEASFLPYYPHAKVISLGESGHYPMQEQPPMLTTAIERFLGESPGYF